MTPLIKDLYTASATATGGRAGRTATDDGILDVALAAPVALGGPGGATNPEQLFAAGYAACFHSALKLVAGADGVDATDSEVVADVSLGAHDNGAFGLSVALEVTIPGTDRDTAEKVVARAHEVCPYSNATRGNIEVVVTVA